MRLTLRLHDERLAVCRLDSGAAAPVWARGRFLSVTRSPAELSVVCDEAAVPAGVRCERDWRALSVEGPLDFDLTGVLASLTGPLAAADVPIFAISTFDTDWVLVRAANIEHAVAALRQAGHRIEQGRVA